MPGKPGSQEEVDAPLLNLKKWSSYHPVLNENFRKA